jgi:hypothetical protein
LHNKLILYLPLPTVPQAVDQNQYFPSMPCVYMYEYGWCIPTVVLRINNNNFVFFFIV